MDLKVSLILATVNNTRELERFFFALDLQRYRNFEVIVVDQNPDDRLQPMIERYQKLFPIRHIRSARGLSRARNAGLKHITGDIVGFPDDDCWYQPALLAELVSWFNAHPEMDGLCGRPTDERGITTIGRFSETGGRITRMNIWTRTNSNTLFFRREVVNRVGGFNEKLGLGSGTPWGSAEDVDYPLRAIGMGFSLYYSPAFQVYHPDVIHNQAYLAERAFSYAAGMGYVMRNHQYPRWYFYYFLLRPLGGAVLQALKRNPARRDYYRYVFKGRLYGWKSCLNKSYSAS